MTAQADQDATLGGTILGMAEFKSFLLNQINFCYLFVHIKTTDSHLNVMQHK
jgi:hypothetical protein